MSVFKILAKGGRGRKQLFNGEGVPTIFLAFSYCLTNSFFLHLHQQYISQDIISIKKKTASTGLKIS